MKIWITRHGQTDLNHKKLMQGRIDQPLNEVGIEQAQAARKNLGNLQFDAVFASPLGRAIATASIIGNVEQEEIRVDERIIETDFGKYDRKSYYLLGPAMSLYWALPEVFPAPKGVESIESMVKRSREFLEDMKREAEDKGYENVLVVCHGGIIRALCGVLEEAPRGICWRPKPKNCEMRCYEIK